MIELKHVTKRIKERTVLDDVSIFLDAGKTYGIRGINGSGKTMLMRAVCGLIYLTSGEVLVEGKTLGKELSFPKSLGLLIENPAFLEAYTGRQNLEFLASLNQRAGRNEIDEAMSKVGLCPSDRRKYRKYSLGMKQRLGIAAAIMENPKILVLDEPLNALDRAGISLFDTIMQEEKEKGKLIILSCHDERKLEEYADVILTMENGRIISNSPVMPG